MIIIEQKTVFASQYLNHKNKKKNLLLKSFILLFCPHGLFPSELFSSIAGLPLLVLPFSTLFQTPNKPPREGHRPLRPQWREDSFTQSGADDL